MTASNLALPARANALDYVLGARPGSAPATQPRLQQAQHPVTLR